MSETTNEKVTVVFVYPDGTRKECSGNIGESVLQIAHKNSVPIQGACEGSLACSTCHVIVEDKDFKGKLAVKSIQEEDMLDLAYDLRPTSRLCCQIKLEPSLEGVVFHVPSGSRNFC